MPESVRPSLDPFDGRLVDEPAALAPWEFRPAPARKEPRPLDANDFAEDRLMKLVRAAVEREIITLSRAAELLGRPLVEMRRISATWTR